MYSKYFSNKTIALYPNKTKVNNFIKKIKQIFPKFTNLNSYNLITKMHPIIKS